MKKRRPSPDYIAQSKRALHIKGLEHQIIELDVRVESKKSPVRPRVMESTGYQRRSLEVQTEMPLSVSRHRLETNGAGEWGRDFSKR